MIDRLLTTIARSRVDAFGRRWQYDVSYLHDIVALGFGAFRPIAALRPMTTYRRDVSAEAYYAVKVTATRAEDCGPCVQLTVRMAEAAGVAPATLRAVLAGDLAALSGGVATAVAWARATLAHDPAADDLRAALEHRYGRAGVVSLAYALVTARLYPTLKYALGHGQTCARIHVDGDVAPVA